MTYRKKILMNERSAKLGLFGAAGSSGRAYIIAPARRGTSWGENRKTAQRERGSGRESTRTCRQRGGGAPFDFAGKHYQLIGVEGSPLPYGNRAPLMMNAGSSPSGRAFAVRYSDMHFDGVQSPEQSIDRIAETKRLARDDGRAVQVWTPIGIVCRPTRREAEEFTEYMVEHADMGAVGNLAQ